MSAILSAVAPSSAEDPSDSLFSEAPNCDQEYESDVLVFPAKFKITGSQLLHDTAVVRTQIVSVGERVANAANDSVVVRQITRVGDATWTLLRDAQSGRWQVCGDPRGVAVYFGVLDDFDSGVDLGRPGIRRATARLGRLREPDSLSGCWRGLRHSDNFVHDAQR